MREQNVAAIGLDARCLNRSAILHDPVRSGLAQQRIAFCCLQRDHPRACRFSRADSRRRIFKNDAIRAGSTPRSAAPFKIRLRVRFSVDNVGRRNQISAGSEFQPRAIAPVLTVACTKSQSSTDSLEERSAIPRAPGRGTTPSISSISIRSTIAFSASWSAFGSNSRMVVRLGRPCARANRLFRIEPVLVRPNRPHSGHRWSGIDQHAVQVKQARLYTEFCVMRNDSSEMQQNASKSKGQFESGNEELTRFDVDFIDETPHPIFTGFDGLHDRDVWWRENVWWHVCSWTNRNSLRGRIRGTSANEPKCRPFSDILRSLWCAASLS